MNDNVRIDLEISKTGIIHYAKVFVNDVPLIGSLIVDSEAYKIIDEWIKTGTYPKVEIIEVN